MSLSSEVLQHIRHLVRGGFEHRNRIITILCEELYAPGELDATEVTATVDAAFAELDKEKANWPAVTDCDRLDAAFDAIRERGIVALQNAGFTQSDGYDDFLAIVARHAHPERIVGYCFFHQQDLEGAVDGKGLYLAFGPRIPAEETTTGLAVGRAIVAELNRAGFQTEWNGTFGTRIFIPWIDWKRRTESDRPRASVGWLANLAAKLRRRWT